MNWLNKNKKWLIAVALVLLTSLLVIRSEFLTIERIAGFAEFSIWLTAFGFIMVYAIKGATMAIPNSLLFIAAGIAFPTWAGILITYAGLTVALSIGYLFGKKLGEEKVNAILAKNKKVADFLGEHKENKMSLCFIAHLLPTPVGLVSLFFGALGVPFVKYIFVSLLGITPMMIPIVFAGAAITDPLSAAFLVPFGISLGLTLIVFIAYKARVVTQVRVAVVLLLAQVILIALLFNRLIHFFPVISLVSYFISIVMVLALVKRDKAAAYKVAWILIIMSLPIVGGVIYLLLGNNRPTRRVAAHVREHALIAKVLDSDAIPPYRERIGCERMAGLMQYIQRASSYHPYENTEVTYYPMGELMFEDMLRALAEAKRFIFLEFFIISKSQMWDRILEILLAKAKEGVDVRVIFDDIGSLGLFTSAYVAELRSKGIKMIRFNPIVPLISPFMNNRNHRKIVVIDGEVGFNGGMNIADEYINLIQRFGLWKDTGVRLRGEAVWSYTLMFIETWDAFCKKGERIDDYMTYKGVAAAEYHGDGLIVPYGDSPLGKERLGENIYIDILNQAQKYVYIFTPYLIISEKMIYAMQMAAKRGVDVRVVMPGIPDKKIVYRLSRSYYKYLLDAGVRVYEYTPGFLHAKSFVCDDEIAVVGTINLDYRSLYLHFECATLLYKSSTVMEVKEDAVQTIAESREVLPEQKRFYHELIDAVLHLFAPLM
ncbi:MAG: cardiolipin synthase [Oscillospiraceae bacterium]|nr:cardiolipin synthase [Oscillospiraceae bacterium]